MHFVKIMERLFSKMKTAKKCLKTANERVNFFSRKASDLSNFSPIFKNSFPNVIIVIFLHKQKFIRLLNTEILLVQVTPVTTA